MALGRFTDINLAASSTLAGGDWSADLPLANLLDASRFVAAPARQLDPTDLAASQFEATLYLPRSISLIALLFHTLSLSARYRVTIAPAGGTLADPVWQSAWTDVYPAVFAQGELEYEAENWWTGQLATEDLALYPRHLWIPLASPLIASKVRVELDDHLNDTGYFDIGGLWLAQTWSPTFNFDRGRELGLNPRDQKNEAPSGRSFSEERVPRRRLTVSWSRLEDAEAERLFDAGARARTIRPVIFAPDFDDPKSTLREAFPAMFTALPTPVRTYDGLGRVSATFEEIIA